MEARVPARTWALLSGLLVVLAVTVGLLGDIRVGSGSDAGGKLATARVMAERSTCDPDIGWWAAEVDPDAELHQIFNTEVMGDRYVQATSPAYQCLLMPLQRVFGPWGPVSVSIAGALVAALAAARIARHLGADPGGQMAAFALVGIVGPVFHYATDVWEHAPAVGLFTAGVALVLGPPRVVRALAAGAGFGAAFVLRAEMVLYVAVLGVVGLAIASVRRRWLASPGPLAAGAFGAAVLAGTNLALERTLLSSSVRTERSANLVESSTSAGDVAERARTALVTGIGVLPSDEPLALLLGAAVVMAVVVAARRCVTGGDGSPAERAAGALVAVRWAYGAGFVPGLFAASPFALVGAWAGRRSDDHRWLVGAGLAAMPVVWALQWPGNLIAQWGGRYVLATGVVLTAAGCSAVRLGRGGWRGAGPLLASCALIGGLGGVWHIQRTAALGSVIDWIEDVPADTVIVTTEVNLAREAGGTYGAVRWLAVAGEAEVDLAERVIEYYRPAHLATVRRAGAEALAFDGYVVAATVQREELGRTFIVDRLDRRPTG